MNETNSTSANLVDPATTKCAIVLDADLPLGLIANTAAVLALTIGSRVPLIGPDIQDGAQSTHVGLTTMPVPILRADAAVLKELREKAQQMENMLVVDVTDAAQTTTNYADYTAKLGASGADTLRYLGIAFFGPKKLVNRLVGNFPLLR